jgi:hypothetical protein
VAATPIERRCAQVRARRPAPTRKSGGAGTGALAVGSGLAAAARITRGLARGVELIISGGSRAPNND